MAPLPEWTINGKDLIGLEEHSASSDEDEPMLAI